MIGGPNGIAGWGLWLLLIFISGVNNLQITANLSVWIPVLIAIALTGNGTYALNAYYDSVGDKINKPNRPIPSGRMSRLHALRYSLVLMALGLAVSVIISVVFNNVQWFGLWFIFTGLGFAYSTPPLKLKSRHIFGNLTFGLFAALIFMISTLQYRAITINEDMLRNIFFQTISIAGIITMKDYYDVEGDKAQGDNTLPVKVGGKLAALISMVLIAIPIVYAVIQRANLGYPPQNFADFFDDNFMNVVIIISFGIYIVLDYIRKHAVLSDPYARVQYYWVILFVAWDFIKRPLGFWGSTRAGLTALQAFIRAYEQSLIIGLYAIVASVAVYRAWRKDRQVEEG
jgi:geranylgeranylglycerol-phosphate geranylgeranyltransferase